MSIYDFQEVLLEHKHSHRLNCFRRMCGIIGDFATSEADIILHNIITQ